MLVKEDIIPDRADKPVFNLAPVLIAAAAMMLWAVIPFGPRMIGADLNIGALYIVAIGSLSTVAVIMAGWSSNNKFALIGAFRVVAQLLSYEVPMVLSIATVVLVVGSMHMGQIVEAQTRAFHLRLAAGLHRLHPVRHRRDRALALRPAGSRVRDRGRLFHRVQRPEVRLVLHRRIRQPDGRLGDRHHAVPGRLARPGRGIRHRSWGRSTSPPRSCWSFSC